MTKYTEHEKQKKVLGDAQTIGGFLEWLLTDYAICKWSDRHEEFLAKHGSVEVWLADYFDIDLGKIEAEKCQMLDEIRAAHSVAAQ